MKLIIYSLFFFLYLNCNAQYREVPVKDLYRVHVNKLMVKNDSLIKKFDFPIIEVDNFEIIFFKSAYNKKEKEFVLSGKVCRGDSLMCSLLSYVGIFKGVRSGDKLEEFVFVGETNGTEKLDSAGYFNIKFKINRNESLFFYMPNFYIREFQLGKLVD